ncbi:MAG: glycosyltransferase family 2 protein [Clostridia bacterium]|nr:glycosyltransferase family 2 protein [Clostridia bacterium]
MKTPYFSILVPVYNVAAYLDTCVQSLVSQTYADFEVILLDDGSPDNSGALCDVWAQKDERIRVIHRENRGLFTTRLDEIEAAQGEYVVFVDSDDYVHEDLLAFLKERIDAHGCDVVTYGRQIVGEGEAVHRLVMAVYPDGTIFEKNARHIILARQYQNNDLNSIWSKCVRRSLLLDMMDELREYEGVNSGEDRIFSAAIFARFTKLMYTDEGLYFYRCNGQGMSNTANVKHFPDSLVCRRAIKHFVETCECEQKEQTVACFWNREWYGSLYLLKEFLRFDISKEQYRDIYAQMMQSVKEYGHCSLKHRMMFFGFHPVFYGPIKFFIKRMWPR